MLVFLYLGIKRMFDWSYVLYGGLVLALIVLLLLGMPRAVRTGGFI